MNERALRARSEELAHVFWVGGSPCSGKSSITQILADEHGLNVYRCDDAYWEHAKRVDPVEQPTFHRLAQMAWDEVWMRPVEVQVAEEIACYRDEFAMIVDDLLALGRSRPIIAEGAALLPDLVSGLLPDRSRAVWVVPSESFQREHYTLEKRPWVKDILRHCQDSTRAFANWMARDVGFAEWVTRRARELDLEVLVVDGKRTVEQNAEAVAEYFGLEKR